MKDLIYVWIDLIEYAALGAMLANLLKGSLQERFHWRVFRAHRLIFLQFALARLFFSYSPLAKRLFYGKAMYIVNSKQSILLLAASFTLTLAFGALCYRKSRGRLLTLTMAFYSLWELVRFTLYPISVSGIHAWVDAYAKNLHPGGLIAFQRNIVRAEILWNMANMAVTVLLLWLFLRKYRQFILACKTAALPKETALLFVPELMGFVFALMLRSILFYYEKEVYSLIDHYPELNILIPCLSLLSASCILLCAKMLGGIKTEQELRRQAELGQSRAEAFYSHIKDMEHISQKIRGMKHDMKHYIADIHALLARISAGDKTAAEEVRHYAGSMNLFLESLSGGQDTKHPVTDEIMGRYARLADQKGIVFSSEFFFPNNLKIDVFDIAAILNNGLDNAFEAAESEPSPAYVSACSWQKGNMFFLSIENSFSGRLQWDSEFPVSKKTEGGHGFGLSNIKNYAERHYGKTDIQVNDGKFRLTVMLQSAK